MCYSKRTNTSSIQTFPPDAGNAQHTTTYPTRSPLKHSTSPPQRYQLPLHHNPYSQRYLQRSFNLTKRRHDSVGLLDPYTIPQSAQNYSHRMPVWTRTYYPACRSQIQPAKHARKTQSAPPHTTEKRNRSQIVSFTSPSCKTYSPPRNTNQLISNPINAQHAHIPLATTNP